VAQTHRDDVLVHLVLESTRDVSRTISFSSNELGTISGFDEQGLLGKIASALDCSIGMGKEQVRDVEPGISVRTTSFEKLVQELAEMYPLYVLDKKGIAIREQVFEGDACFLMTDHIPMPKKSFNGLKRLGAINISLGPKMLFASQCVVLIHNELDLRQ
jgi:tRNA (pseudouridine54-N1)-methyltransferase